MVNDNEFELNWYENRALSLCPRLCVVFWSILLNLGNCHLVLCEYEWCFFHFESNTYCWSQKSPVISTC